MSAVPYEERRLLLVNGENYRPQPFFVGRFVCQ
jgi:hypothetical protein